MFEIIVAEHMKPSGGPGLDAFFSILGKQGAIEILTQATEEFRSGKDAVRRMGLSQKLYYSRLAELIRLGLIQRQGLRSYRATERGRLVLDMQDRLCRALAQNRPSLPLESRLVPTYPEMVRTLSEQIDRAAKRIKIATRYVDPTIAKGVFDALDRNVYVQVVYKSNMTHLGELALDLLGLVKKDIASQAQALWRNTRVANIPFSFAVVDGDWSGIELIGSDDTFLSAIEFEGRAAAEAVGVLFRHYYRIGTLFPRFW